MYINFRIQHDDVVYDVRILSFMITNTVAVKLMITCLCMSILLGQNNKILLFRNDKAVSSTILKNSLNT